MYRLFVLFIALLVCGSTMGSTITTIDFSTDENGSPIVNGQKIDDEYGSIFTVSDVPSKLGIAAFDSSPTGPNNTDPQLTDMLVDLGHVLVYQSLQHPGITGDIFDTPHDYSAGGSIVFDFVSPENPTEITLIDLDDNAGAIVTLTDSSGLTRTYDVPDFWTKDRRNGPLGYASLDLTTLADQTGETAVVATAMEDAGFNGSAVTQMQVRLLGSGGVDNLVLGVVPEPTSLSGLMIVLGLIVTRIRRR